MTGPFGAAAGAKVPVGNEQAPPAPPPNKDAIDLSNGELRDAVAADRQGDALPSDLQTAGGDSVVVEALFRDGNGRDARDAITAVGGAPNGSVPGELIQAVVPVDELVALEGDPAVTYVRPPLTYDEPVGRVTTKPSFLTEVGSQGDAGSFIGEQIQKTNAAAWHAAGFTGQGVKVGIIDAFSQPKYNAAIAGGETSAASGTFCLSGGVACNIFAAAADHGVGVMETVSDMAPSAQLYIATVSTASDAQAAVNFFASQGVKIITRSQTGRYDGPGNGTGPIDTVIDSAVSQGMNWFNSAGNSAGRNGSLGTYWRGGFVDADIDGYAEFDGAGDELMKFDCSFLNGLRWSDFGQGAATTDYDFELWNSTPTKIAESINSQGASGGTAQPIELINSFTCPAGGFAYMAVKRFAAGGGTAGDVLEIMTNGAEIEHPQNPFSATGPMADSANPGMISVGAVDPAVGTTIADYSSEGPTNDMRMKPDLSAASCLQNLTFSPSCFNGTSAASPVAAGAGALALSAGAASSPQSVKTFLMSSTVDRGAGGPDNVYGQGELVLPNPPQAADHTPPTVRAIRSSGKRGKFTKLKYTASDDSGSSQETVKVFNRGHVLKTIQSVYGESTGGTYGVRYRIPSLIKGLTSFCVTAADAGGNVSATSCAGLRVKRKRRHHHH